MSKKTRRTFTKEFKEDAIRLLLDGNVQVRELSVRLGVSRNVLFRWKQEAKQAGADAFPGKGNQTALEEAKKSTSSKKSARS